ncbi:MAG: uracil-DNA glycosylase family protein [Acidobacteriota bacterium]|nr:uracil-DNA glycosylase family protein [Acidobacteriota bacterium]
MDQSRELLREVRQCRHCEAHLPLGPRPVIQVHPDAKILIIGQAPGTRVHASGVPWDDPSGNRLRAWMGLDKAEFYDETLVGILPMGFCYPGKGTSGDLPPRPECAPLWHPRLLAMMSKVRLTLLIGRYAQARYLGPERKANLTQTVRAWADFLPTRLPLPHPSPRNARWQAKNPWFDKEVIPALREAVRLARADDQTEAV